MFAPRILYLHSQLAPDSSIERFAELLDPKTVGLTDKSQYYAPVRFTVQICGGINAAAGAIRLDVPVHANPNWLQVMKSRFSGMCGVAAAKSMDFKTITGKSISEFAPDELSQVGKLNVFVDNKLLRLPQMPTVPVEYSVNKSEHIQKWFNEKVAPVLPELVASELSKCNSEHEINKAIEPNGIVQKTIEKTIRDSLEGKSWTEFVRTHHMNSPSYMPKEFSADTLKSISSDMLQHVRQFVGAASDDIEAYLAHVRSKKLSKDPDYAPVLGKVNNNTPKINGQKMFNKLMQDAISTPTLLHSVVDTLYTQPIGRGCRWDDDKPVVTKTTSRKPYSSGGITAANTNKLGVNPVVYAQLYNDLQEDEKKFVQNIAVLLKKIADSNTFVTSTELVQSMDNLHTKLGGGVLSEKLTKAIAYAYGFSLSASDTIKAFSAAEIKFVIAFATYLIGILSNSVLKQYFVIERPHVPQQQKDQEALIIGIVEQRTSNRGGLGGLTKNVVQTLVNLVSGTEKEVDISSDAAYYVKDAAKQCNVTEAKAILTQYYDILKPLIEKKGYIYSYSGDYFAKAEQSILGTFAEDNLPKAIAERERILMEAKNNKTDDLFNNQIFDVVTYYAARFLYDIRSVPDNQDKINLFLQLVTNRHVEKRRGAWDIDYMASRDMSRVESQRAQAQSVVVLQQTQPSLPSQAPPPPPPQQELPAQAPPPPPEEEEEAPPVPEKEVVFESARKDGPAPPVPAKDSGNYGLQWENIQDQDEADVSIASLDRNALTQDDLRVYLRRYSELNDDVKANVSGISDGFRQFSRRILEALGKPNNKSNVGGDILFTNAKAEIQTFKKLNNIESHHPWNALIHHSLFPVNGAYPTYYNVLHTKQDMSKDAPYVGGDLNETYKYYHMFMGGAMMPPGKVINQKPVESSIPVVQTVESKMRERLVPIAARPPLVHISKIRPAERTPIRVAPVRARLVDTTPKRVESEETETVVEKKLHYTQLPSVNDVFDD